MDFSQTDISVQTKSRLLVLFVIGQSHDLDGIKISITNYTGV
jgi:hypothetical protein